MGPRRLPCRLLIQHGAGPLLSAEGRSRSSAASLPQARRSSSCLAQPGVVETDANHRLTRAARCSVGGILVRHVDERRMRRVLMMSGRRHPRPANERAGGTARPAKTRRKRASACTHLERGRSCTSCSRLPHHRHSDRRSSTWSWPCGVRAMVWVRRLPSPENGAAAMYQGV